MKILVVLALVALATAKTRYDNYQLWDVTPKTMTEVNVALLMTEDPQLDVWNDRFDVDTAIQVLVPPHKIEELEDFLGMNNIEYVVAEKNFQTVLDEEDALLAEKRDFDLNNWNTYEDIMNQLDVWVGQCPEGFTCAAETIGTSDGGNAIKMLTIEKAGDDREGIWIDSLIHSREWLAGSTLLNFMERLINGNDAEAVNLRENYNLYLSPVSNPDGYLYTFDGDRLWRKNRKVNSGSVCRGVDLNRNFRAYWNNGGTSASPCSDIFRGPSAGSEAETEAIEYAIATWDISIFVHIHAYANMWLHPWGYGENNNCVISDDHAAQNAVAAAATTATEAVYGTTWTYGNICQTIYIASGSAADYAYDQGITYAFSPELRGTSFIVNVNQIAPAYLETWAGLVALVNAA